ncbi:hypothetical protein CH333_03075 [candidate division WOR-3 bacterium JGI_Cruoil_03_44_89]|uniref:Uncharacterized protein n=1 Tax=candidate division WOR-3 bacterium JGI_Cruoil_03_44_89 TaxID=1973748 RepID=A0A235BW38_UNCW3|nr:MAG: hypothetical protein CH333_03075 [candidate division WOR-3 bacterium JGI_Cruoil_03_44_89]
MEKEEEVKYKYWNEGTPPKKGMRVKVFSCDGTQYLGKGKIIEVYGGIDKEHCLIRMDSGREIYSRHYTWVWEKLADKVEKSLIGYVFFQRPANDNRRSGEAKTF